MAEEDQKSGCTATPTESSGRRWFLLSLRPKQDIATARTMLQPLPPSLDFQERVNMGPIQYQPAQENTSVLHAILQDFQYMAAHYNRTVQRLDLVVRQGNLPQWMTQPQPGQQGLRPDGSTPDITGPRPRRGPVFGIGVDQSTTFKQSAKRQSNSSRRQSGVKSFTDWLAKRAPASQLKDIWIQFDDPPRIAIDGFYLREFLKRKEDVSPDMAVSMIRMLRKYEAMKNNNPEDDCHFVDHYWAEFVMKDAGSIAECFKLFTRPELLTPLEMCKRVVAMVDLEGKWASVSIDIPNGITHLIHPALAGHPEDAVLATYRPMCEKLTIVAVSHMMPYRVSTKSITEWIYSAPLEEQKKPHVNDSGVCAAYYSIPKSRQFMTVAAESIVESRRSFVHELVKYCHKKTGKTVKVARLILEDKSQDNNPVASNAGSNIGPTQPQQAD